MQLDEFTGTIKNLEPGIDQKKIIDLFKEALDYGEGTAGILDSIDPEILVKIIMSYKLGGYGKEFFS